MTNQTQIPEGYKQDGKGNLIPIANIKEIDLVKDELVERIAKEAKEKSALLSTFKINVMRELASYVQLSAAEYGVKLGGNKGNLTLFSYNGKYKVQRAMSDTITFDEKLQVAKELIDECLNKWSEGAKPELCLIIKDAFDVDKQGKLNTAKILELRRYVIDDENWKKAIQIIDDSITILCSKAYLRFYERDDNGGYNPISLDVAGV